MPIIDTNILADLVWKRDKNVVHLIRNITSEFKDEFLIVVPRICVVEFKSIY